VIVFVLVVIVLRAWEIQGGTLYRVVVAALCDGRTTLLILIYYTFLS